MTVQPYSLTFLSSDLLSDRQLFETGLFVDPHHDPDTPSGLEVNSTLYYLLSSFPSAMHGVTSTLSQKEEMEKLLHIPDHCFGGPPTM